MSALDPILVAWARGPDHPLRLRLIDALCRRRRGDRLLTVPYREGTHLRVDPCTHIGRHILYNGVYEEPIFDAIMRHLPRGGVFADIGCHVGAFAIPAARRCRRVLAVDAFAPMIDILRGTVKLNGLENVDTVTAAVSDRVGDGPLFIAADRQMTSLSTDWSVAQAEPLVVRTSTLAAMVDERRIEAIDVLKIDAEGMSGAVLEGADPVLPRIRAVIFEADDDGGARATAILRRHGFDVRSLPGGDAANFLATR